MVTPCTPSFSNRPELGSRAASGSPTLPRERQAGYSARLRIAGLAQVAVWVPVSQAAHIHAEAMRLRSEAGLLLPAEHDPAQLNLFPVETGAGVTR